MVENILLRRLLTGVFLLFLCLQAHAREEGKHSATQTTKSKPGQWSYAGETGPDHWASLSQDFAACGSGTRQSPIDLNASQRTLLPPLNIHYRTSVTSIRRSPHLLRLDYDSGSYLKIKGQRYRLVGFDFHTPGEHAIQGQRSDMEIHLHHLGPQGEPLILAIPVMGGHRKNITLQRIFENIPSVSASSYNRRVGINALFLLPRDRSYFTYEGSETRPPCAETIQWIVFKTPTRVSWEEINHIKTIVGLNARPVQPLNGRVVWVGDN